MKLSLAHLPQTARDLVELIGAAATLRLIEAAAGQVLAIPKVKREQGRALLRNLAAIVGDEAAAAIVGRWGGEYLTIPACKRAGQAVRDAELLARFDALLRQGLGSRAIVNRLAGEFGLNASTVWRIAKRGAGDPATLPAIGETRQGELFR